MIVLDPIARCKGITADGRECRRQIWRYELEANGNQYYCAEHLAQGSGELPRVSARRLRQLVRDARARAAAKARLDPGCLASE